MKQNQNGNKKIIQKPRKVSMVMGIVGICVGLIVSPLIGVVLGVVGLSIKKQEDKETRDIVLNTLAICAGIVSFIINLIVYAHNPEIFNKLIGL